MSDFVHRHGFRRAAPAGTRAASLDGMSSRPPCIQGQLDSSLTGAAREE
jgi:hypothetical protein